MPCHLHGYLYTPAQPSESRALAEQPRSLWWNGLPGVWLCPLSLWKNEYWVYCYKCNFPVTRSHCSLLLQQKESRYFDFWLKNILASSTREECSSRILTQIRSFEIRSNKHKLGSILRAILWTGFIIEITLFQFFPMDRTPELRMHFNKFDPSRCMSSQSIFSANQQWCVSENSRHLQAKNVLRFIQMFEATLHRPMIVFYQELYCVSSLAFALQRPHDLWYWADKY